MWPTKQATTSTTTCIAVSLCMQINMTQISRCVTCCTHDIVKFSQPQTGVHCSDASFPSSTSPADALRLSSTSIVSVPFQFSCFRGAPEDCVKHLPTWHHFHRCQCHQQQDRPTPSTMSSIHSGKKQRQSGGDGNNNISEIMNLQLAQASVTISDSRIVQTWKQASLLNTISHHRCSVLV